MSWSTFWWPNIVQATLFAAISAIVSALVALAVRWAWKRWGKPWVQAIAADLLVEQRATAAATNDAVAASRVAAEHATSASADARTASDNSRQANEVLEWLVPQIAARDAVIDDLKERIDRLLGTRARQLAATRVDSVPTGLLIPRDAGDENDPTTTTGRHRLHTQHVQIIDEGDHL